ncbi:Gfo/Idh/MocA family protein [Jeotgalibacillus terrae]|uniref:Gfo/Idh/MocA family protein n=1 Tax=Jeotgalibacillus terrae TaxID=587735 RepID=A0ABW5ZGC8_9BACL|nr:Gfo/Idh/MocA family oxidoreductase [Jeotgalibacillus terrae]MBM7580113.1 putative dehydrogenase [Jeotgalibacillus terrae]
MKIGMMSFAHMHAYSYADALKKQGIEISAIFDDDSSRAAQLEKDFGIQVDRTYETFFSNEIDAVIVCSENSRHLEMVQYAARNKKHILCEKPLALSLDDCRTMINVCKEHHVLLQTAFPVRFNSVICNLKEQIDHGDVGDIIAFRTTNRGQNPGGWFIDASKAGGGAVLDHTVHMVDIMRWFTGSEVKEVQAFVDTIYHEGEIDDTGLLMIEFENGVIASHDASWSRYPDYPTWGDVMIEVIGTKKTIRADAFGEHLSIFHKNKSQNLTYDFVGQDMDYGLISDFIESVQNLRSPSITGEDGMRAVEAALMAYESAKKNETVRK